ncbi:MAG: LuxR family transcriptional regulator [Burkholderiales bacterium]|nr:MAG: LuxR family transcriptional regulator [Burkholderiales bacterium]
MNLGHYEEIAAAATKDDLKARLVEFTSHVGFERFALVLERTLVDGTKRYHSLTNAPDGFSEVQVDNSIAAVDPVHSHLRSSLTPIVYTQQTYVDAGVPDLWDMVAPFGYSVGIGVSMVAPGVGRVMLGIDRASALPKDENALGRLASDLQLLAQYSQDVAQRLLAGAFTPELTGHQMAVLQLIGEGKSNSVIATLLGVSENTVKYHVGTLFRRMNVATREQAVRAACRAGLID